jgi:hypothetical protein
MSDYLMNMIKDNVDKVMVQKTIKSYYRKKTNYHSICVNLINPFDYTDDYTPLRKIGEKYIITWLNKKDEKKVIQIEFKIKDDELENDEIYKYLLANYKFHWIEV